MHPLETHSLAANFGERPPIGLRVFFSADKRQVLPRSKIRRRK
jgi:hypothetical protein